MNKKSKLISAVSWKGPHYLFNSHTTGSISHPTSFEDVTSQSLLLRSTALPSYPGYIIEKKPFFEMRQPAQSSSQSSESDFELLSFLLQC